MTDNSLILHLLRKDLVANMYHCFGIRVFHPTPLDGSSISTKWVKVSDIRYLSFQLRKQHPRRKKSVSRISLWVAVYVCTWDSIRKGWANSLHPWPYQCIWKQMVFIGIKMYEQNNKITFILCQVHIQK